MSKGGGGGSTTTVQKADPWSGLQGPLRDFYSNAQNWYNSGGPQYFPGDTVAAPRGLQIDALNKGADMASAGPTQLMKNAGSTLEATAGGKYLSPDSNPYLAGMYQAAADPVVRNFKDAVTPGIASQFALGGRLGSGANQAAFNNATATLGHTLGDMANNLYGTAYGQERNLQQQASLAAPAFDQAKYNDVNKLLGIGEYQQNLAQQQLDQGKARWDFEQNRPLMNLQALNQLLQGGSVYAGSTSTGRNSMNRNPFASGLGGAFMTNALGNSIGGEFGGMLGGPWGALGGALLGGLFG